MIERGMPRKKYSKGILKSSKVIRPFVGNALAHDLPMIKPKLLKVTKISNSTQAIDFIADMIPTRWPCVPQRPGVSCLTSQYVLLSRVW